MSMTPQQFLLLTHLGAFQANQLIITVQPPPATAINGVMGVTVSATNDMGQVDPTFSDTVHVTFGINPTGAGLHGTTTLTASQGVAGFAGLSVDKLGTGYALNATSGSLPVVQTDTFDILPPGHRRSLLPYEIGTRRNL